MDLVKSFHRGIQICIDHLSNSECQMTFDDDLTEFAASDCTTLRGSYTCRDSGQESSTGEDSGLYRSPSANRDCCTQFIGDCSDPVICFSNEDLKETNLSGDCARFWLPVDNPLAFNKAASNCSNSSNCLLTGIPPPGFDAFLEDKDSCDDVGWFFEEEPITEPAAFIPLHETASNPSMSVLPELQCPVKICEPDDGDQRPSECKIGNSDNARPKFRRSVDDNVSDDFDDCFDDVARGYDSPVRHSDVPVNSTVLDGHLTATSVPLLDENVAWPFKNSLQAHCTDSHSVDENLNTALTNRFESSVLNKSVFGNYHGLRAGLSRSRHFRTVKTAVDEFDKAGILATEALDAAAELCANFNLISTETSVAPPLGMYRSNQTAMMTENCGENNYVETINVAIAQDFSGRNVYSRHFKTTVTTGHGNMTAAAVDSADAEGEQRRCTSVGRDADFNRRLQSLGFGLSHGADDVMSLALNISHRQLTQGEKQ